MMIGREAHAAALGEPLGRGEVRRPAFEHHRAAHRAAQRSAHALPGDGRAGVQDQALGVELGDQLARAPHADEHRVGGEDAAQRFGVGVLDLLCPRLQR